MSNLLTVVSYADKLPGDLMVRVQDNLIVGRVRDNGALDINCNDESLNILWCRKGLGAVSEDGTWITDTGVEVHEYRGTGTIPTIKDLQLVAKKRR